MKDKIWNFLVRVSSILGILAQISCIVLLTMVAWCDSHPDNKELAEALFSGVFLIYCEVQRQFKNLNDQIYDS